MHKTVESRKNKPNHNYFIKVIQDLDIEIINNFYVCIKNISLQEYENKLKKKLHKAKGEIHLFSSKELVIELTRLEKLLKQTSEANKISLDYYNNFKKGISDIDFEDNEYLPIHYHLQECFNINKIDNYIAIQVPEYSTDFFINLLQIISIKQAYLKKYLDHINEIKNNTSTNEIIIDRNSFFYGLIHSDFEYLLLNRYHEAKLSFYEFLDGLNKENPKKIIQFIDLWINSLNNHIAEKEQDLINLSLKLKAKHEIPNIIDSDAIKHGETNKIIKKCKCLVDDLEFYKKFAAGDKPHTQKKGFVSNLKDDQIQRIFEEVQGKYINTTLKNFVAIFKYQTLPPDFVHVKWIYLNNKKRPNQTVLREFLKATMQFETKEPDQKTIDNCFRDQEGARIVLGKNKVTPYTERWTKKFKALIK